MFRRSLRHTRNSRLRQCSKSSYILYCVGKLSSGENSAPYLQYAVEGGLLQPTHNENTLWMVAPHSRSSSRYPFKQLRASKQWRLLTTLSEPGGDHTFAHWNPIRTIRQPFADDNTWTQSDQCIGGAISLGVLLVCFLGRINAKGHRSCRSNLYVHRLCTSDKVL